MNRKNSIGDGYEYNEVSNLSVDELNTLGARGWFCVTLARVPGGKGWSGLMGRLINVAEEVSTTGTPLTVEVMREHFDAQKDQVKQIGKQLEGFVEHPTSVQIEALKEEARLRGWKEGDPKGLWYRPEGRHWVVGLGGWREPGEIGTKMEKDPGRRLDDALTAWAPTDARVRGWTRDEEGNWEDGGGIVRVVSDEEKDGKWWPGDGPEDRAVRIALLSELAAKAYPASKLTMEEVLDSNGTQEGISEFFRSRSDPSSAAVLSDAPASGEESSASERETIRLKVFRMLASERAKQIEKYGDDHDDAHVHGELAVTAAYLLRPISPGLAPEWAEDLRKKHASDRVRQLVIAAALSIREIERLLRAEKRQEKT